MCSKAMEIPLGLVESTSKHESSRYLLITYSEEFGLGTLKNSQVQESAHV